MTEIGEEFYATALWATKRTRLFRMETQDRYQAAWAAMLRRPIDESLPFLSRMVYLRQAALGGIIDAMNSGTTVRRVLEFKRFRADGEPMDPWTWRFPKSQSLSAIPSPDPRPDRVADERDFAAWVAELPEPQRTIAERVIEGGAPVVSAMETGLSKFHAEQAVDILRRLLDERRKRYRKEVQRDSAQGSDSRPRPHNGNGRPSGGALA